MTIERHNFATEEEWLAARAKDITSTDVAALPGLDVSPYLSPWELFHRKKTGEVPSIIPSERMKWGSRLQDAIAEGVASDFGLTVARLKEYMRRPEYRIGSSFDFLVLPHGSPGLMEVKNVDSLAYHSTWTDEDGVIEAPPHIELQVQHQMLVSGMPWCLLVALVGGNTIRTTRRERDEAVGKIILKKVAEFWMMVEEDRAPAPDFSRDAAAIARLYRTSDPGSVIDLSLDTEAETLALLYNMAASEEKQVEEKKLSAKARLLQKIGTAEKGLGNGWSVSAKEVKESPGKVITAAMVGTIIGGRKGYRDFRVNIKKGGSNVAVGKG